MAIQLTITGKDVKADKVVRPGWYLALITAVVQEIAKDKESHNIVVDVEGLEGDCAGVPIKCWFSEKFPQGAIAFVRATGGKISEETGVDPAYDFEKQVQKRVKIKLVHNRGKSGDEKPRNMIEDWAPADPAGEAAPAVMAVGGFGTV